jgi:glutamine amidotransferase
VINFDREVTTVDTGTIREEYRPRIAIVDYRAGNLRSVSRALQAAGADAFVTEARDEIAAADAVVLPGVGAARSAMRELEQRRLIEPVQDAVRSGRPFLGVCLGLQVLMTRSEEDGGVDCLGIIPGTVVRLRGDLKIPHMGWNQVRQRARHRLFQGIPDLADFYFVHSFVVIPDDPSIIVGDTDYGGSFASALGYRNVLATQFHPEKSADAGLLIYRNFTRWVANTASVAAGAVVDHV